MPQTEATTKVVEVGGKKVLRTITTRDRTLDALQQEVSELDKSITRARARVITPMETRKTAIEAEIALLEGEEA